MATQAVSPAGALGAVGPPRQTERATVPAEPQRLSAKELRERQQRADEAARIIETNTPEM